MSTDSLQQQIAKPPTLNPDINQLLKSSSTSSISESIFQRPLNLAVAHDGSLPSKAALQFANLYLTGMSRGSGSGGSGKNIHLDVLHVYEPADEVQSKLDRQYKMSTIKSELEPYDISLGNRFECHYINVNQALKYHTVTGNSSGSPNQGNNDNNIHGSVTKALMERSGSKDAQAGVAGKKEGKQIVDWSYCREADGKSIDFMFMGFSGKNTASESDLLQSDVSYTLQYLRCSTIIIKKDSHIPTKTDESAIKQLHVLVCIDLSKASEKALYDALALTGDGDRITCFHSRVVEEEGKTDRDTADDYYLEMIARIKKSDSENSTSKINRTIDYRSVRHGGEGPWYDIVKYCEQQDESSNESDQIDLVIMGTDCQRLRESKSYLGSNAAKIIQKLSKPIVIAKYDDSFGSVMTADEKMMASVPVFA